MSLKMLISCALLGFPIYELYTERAMLPHLPQKRWKINFQSGAIFFPAKNKQFFFPRTKNGLNLVPKINVHGYKNIIIAVILILKTLL